MDKRTRKQCHQYAKRPPPHHLPLSGVRIRDEMFEGRSIHDLRLLPLELETLAKVATGCDLACLRRRMKNLHGEIRPRKVGGR
jgi:hypothetical protein